MLDEKDTVKLIRINIIDNKPRGVFLTPDNHKIELWIEKNRSGDEINWLCKEVPKLRWLLAGGSDEI